MYSGLSIRKVEEAFGINHSKHITKKSCDETIVSVEEVQSLSDLLDKRIGREKRKDIRDRNIVSIFMHNDKYTRLDNNSKLVKIKGKDNEYICWCR